MGAMDKKIEQLIEDVRDGNIDTDELKMQLDRVAEAAAESALEGKDVDVTQRERIDSLARKASRL